MKWRTRNRIFSLMAAVAGMALCVPQAYADPTVPAPAIPDAMVRDRVGSPDDRNDLFILEAIDGRPVEWTAREASMRASIGSNFVGVATSHPVSAGRHRLQIGLVRGYPSLASQLFHLASDHPLEGVVDVELRSDVVYTVTGVVNRFRKEVFLRELASRDDSFVGDKIVQVLEDPKWLPVKASASYTCCNLHYDDDTITDANWTGLPFLPAGSRIVVRERKKNKASVWLEGQDTEIDLEDGDHLASVESVLARIVVAEDPNTKIATYPEAVQKAIHAGRVFAGMTREQVIVSLGYPRLDTNSSLDAPTWKYGTDEKNPYTLFWAADGTLERVDGSAKARALVEVRQ
jgi:hypothetical protein